MAATSTRRVRGALLAVLAGLCVTACISRPVDTDVYREGGVEVYLREEKGFVNVVEKGYDHPKPIAQTRVAHILSRIDIRPAGGDGKAREPAIHTDLLYSIADGISQALEQAGPDQEVVVMAIRRWRRFKIFDRKMLTSFICYVRDDRLYIHMSRVEWEIPPRREDRIPEPRLGDHPQDFRIYSGMAMTVVNPQSVAVEWRSPAFSRATRTRILPTGEVVRREILMESPPEEWADEAPVSEGVLDDLSPDQLRALADLEEERRAGTITEAQYKTRRREIVGN